MKTAEFIIGFACASITDKMNKFLEINESERMSVDCYIPKSFFDNCQHNYLTEVSKHKLNKVLRGCWVHLSKIFDKYFIEVRTSYFKETVNFKFIFTKKDIPKCMTKEQIEEALGYKITLIDN